MRLSPSRFDRHIAFMGQDVRWRQATSCPCANPDSGQPKPTCPLCRGKGFTWTSFHTDAVCGVTSISNMRNLKEFGTFDSGDSVLTVPENVSFYDSIGRPDRVTLMNARQKFTHTFIRGVDDQSYTFTPVVINRVYWLDSTGKVQIDGGIPTVDANGVPTWTADEPPAGTQYSITGTSYDDYFVWDSIASTRQEHAGARLPLKFQLRKFDLFNR